jgi:hypothetical protein
VSSVSHVVDSGAGESRAGIAADPSRVLGRLVAVAALGVAILYFASVPVGSLASLPGTDVSPARVLAFFVGHRDGVLVGVVLNGIAWCALMPVVFVGLRLRITGEGSGAASIALAGALVESALIGVALVFGGLAAYAAPDLSPALARLLADGLALATSFSAWPTVVCAVAMAVAIRRSRVLPAYTANLALAVALLHCAAGVGLARAGALSPAGIALVAPPAFAVWMAVIGVSMLRRAPEFVAGRSDA